VSQSHGIALLIRWVLVRDPLVRDPLVRDPLVRFDPQALLCTDLELAPLAIVQRFIPRWQVEVTFEEARRHLGLETQRQWSDKAVAPTTPVLLSLFSFVTLLGDRLVRAGMLPIRRTARYQKATPTFSHALTAVRAELWRHESFHISTSLGHMPKPARRLLTRLTAILCEAA
jgi:hypothetical protein